MHKTIGGWQFGVRYLADGLPFLLFYMMYRMEAPKKQQLTTIDLTETTFSIILAFGAIVLNFYGCLWLFKNWN
jgi:hypothetical protein